MHWRFTHHLARLLIEALFSIGKRKLHPRILGYSYEEMSTNSISNCPIGMWCNISDLCKHIWLHCFTCVQSPTHWSCKQHIAQLLTGIYYFKNKNKKEVKTPKELRLRLWTNVHQFHPVLPVPIFYAKTQNLTELCKHILLHVFVFVQSPFHWSFAHHIARLLAGSILQQWEV